jgi:hypothetical protein
MMNKWLGYVSRLEKNVVTKIQGREMTGNPVRANRNGGLHRRPFQDLNRPVVSHSLEDLTVETSL